MSVINQAYALRTLNLVTFDPRDIDYDSKVSMDQASIIRLENYFANGLEDKLTSELARKFLKLEHHLTTADCQTLAKAHKLERSSGCAKLAHKIGEIFLVIITLGFYKTLDKRLNTALTHHLSPFLREIAFIQTPFIDAYTSAQGREGYKSAFFKAQHAFTTKLLALLKKNGMDVISDLKVRFKHACHYKSPTDASVTLMRSGVPQTHYTAMKTLSHNLSSKAYPTEAIKELRVKLSEEIAQLRLNPRWIYQPDEQFDELWQQAETSVLTVYHVIPEENPIFNDERKLMYVHLLTLYHTLGRENFGLLQFENAMFDLMAHAARQGWATTYPTDQPYSEIDPVVEDDRLSVHSAP